MEKQLERIAKKHRPADILDELAKLYEKWATERGKLSKRYHKKFWKEAAFDSACEFRRAAREIRKAAGALRRADST